MKCAPEVMRREQHLETDMRRASPANLRSSPMREVRLRLVKSIRRAAANHWNQRSINPPLRRRRYLRTFWPDAAMFTMVISEDDYRFGQADTR